MNSVIICPGHYEAYKGVNKNGFYEYDEVLKIANHVCDEISTKVNVKLVDGSLVDKIKVIETEKPDLAIEIHCGNTNNPNLSGSRAFFMLNSDNSKKLADCLLESCVRVLGTANRGSYIGWYKKITPRMVTDGKAPADWKPKIDLFLSKSICPSAIIEPFFISAVSDTKRFIIGDKHKFIAFAISDGIMEYLRWMNSQNSIGEQVKELEAA